MEAVVADVVVIAGGRRGFVGLAESCGGFGGDAGEGHREVAVDVESFADVVRVQGGFGGAEVG